MKWKLRDLRDTVQELNSTTDEYIVTMEAHTEAHESWLDKGLKRGESRGKGIREQKTDPFGPGSNKAHEGDIEKKIDIMGDKIDDIHKILSTPSKPWNK